MPVSTSATACIIGSLNAQNTDNSVRVQNVMLAKASSSVSLCVETVIALQNESLRALQGAPRVGITCMDMLLQTDAYLQSSHNLLKMLLVLRCDPVLVQDLFQRYEAQKADFDAAKMRITNSHWFKRMFTLGDRSLVCDVLKLTKKIHDEIKSVSDSTNDAITKTKISQRLLLRPRSHSFSSEPLGTHSGPDEENVQATTSHTQSALFRQS